VTTRQLKRKTEGSALKALVPDSGAHIVERTGDYGRLVSDISGLLEQARCTAVRSTNSILTAAYWEIGRRIVEFEQGGKARAEYGEQLLIWLSRDFTAKFGRGFSRSNLQQMRLFYLGWEICQTPSGKLEAHAVIPAASRRIRVKNCQTLFGQFETQVKLSTVAEERRAKKCQTPSAKSEARGVVPELSLESAEVLAPAATSTQWVSALPSAFPLSWSQYVHLMSVANPQDEHRQVQRPHL